MTGHSSNFLRQMERARAGEPDGVHNLVLEFEPQLVRAIQRRRQKHSPQMRILYDTRDCLQSVFVGFYGKISSAKELSSVTSFRRLRRLLLKMSRDKLIDYERRDAAAKRPIYSEGFSDPIDENARTPSSIASQNEEMQKLSGTHSESRQQILELAFRGHSSQEIAEMVGSTSGRSIRRFLQKLIKRFTK